LSQEDIYPVRIDHIFIHNWDVQHRAFIRAAEVNITPLYDEVLECKILRLQPEKTATVAFRQSAQSDSTLSLLPKT
jgi:hypothetical protein